MKITQLSIKNFKSVEELVIRDIEDVLILVGRNNAGKSDRKSTRLNSSHSDRSRMPSSA